MRTSGAAGQWQDSSARGGSLTSLKGHVAKILSPYSVVIDLGSKHGVNRGDRFIIYELGEPVFDQEGKELEKLELVKGQVEVTHVQELISVAESFTVEKRTYTPFPYLDIMQRTEYTVKETKKLAETTETPAKPNPVKPGDLVRRIYEVT